VITTNRAVGAWGEVLGDTIVAAVTLERLRNVDAASNELHMRQRAQSSADPTLDLGSFNDQDWGISLSAVYAPGRSVECSHTGRADPTPAKFPRDTVDQ